MKKLIILILVCVFAIGINAQTYQNKLCIQGNYQTCTEYDYSNKLNTNNEYTNISLGYERYLFKDKIFNLKSGIYWGYLDAEKTGREYKMGNFKKNICIKSFCSEYIKLPLNACIIIQDENEVSLELYGGMNFYQFINDDDFQGLKGYNAGFEWCVKQFAFGLNVEWSNNFREISFKRNTREILALINCNIGYRF